MPIDSRKIIGSPFGLKIAYLIGKYMPYPLGYRIAYFIADRISSQKSLGLVQAVRGNQWVVNGGNLDKVALDKLVRQNFRGIACSIFDMYHTLNNPTAALRIIEPNPTAIQLVQRPEYYTRGLILAGVHMSNFDMVFHVGGLAGVKAMAITLPELDAGYRVQWDMRAKQGFKIVQASVGSIKQAVNHLRDGGMVITAIDRPDKNNTYHPIFFGNPAPLPIHHIFLALKAHVPVVIVAVLKRTDGKYHILFSEPIEMVPHADRRMEMMINAENTLRVAESFIRQDPSQWAMTFPVWPEVFAQVPA